MPACVHGVSPSCERCQREHLVFVGGSARSLRHGLGPVPPATQAPDQRPEETEA